MNKELLAKKKGAIFSCIDVLSCLPDNDLTIAGEKRLILDAANALSTYPVNGSSRKISYGCNGDYIVSKVEKLLYQCLSGTPGNISLYDLLFMLEDALNDLDPETNTEAA